MHHLVKNYALNVYSVNINSDYKIIQEVFMEFLQCVENGAVRIETK